MLNYTSDSAGNAHRSLWCRVSAACLRMACSPAAERVSPFPVLKNRSEAVHSPQVRIGKVYTQKPPTPNCQVWIRAIVMGCVSSRRNGKMDQGVGKGRPMGAACKALVWDYAFGKFSSLRNDNCWKRQACFPQHVPTSTHYVEPLHAYNFVRVCASLKKTTKNRVWEEGS